MRFCRLRKKKGGGEFKFDKPSTKFSSSGQALENYNKQQDIQNKADSAALQAGGAGDEITVPTMGDNPEGNASIRTAVSGLAKSDADGEFDTPPKIGGRRRTKRKRKKGRRLTKICVKKCTRKCYTPKRGGKRRKSRRKKNRKKRTRRHGGVKTPPRKKKTPKPVVSPPSKRKPWARKFTPTLKTPAREFYAVKGKTNPAELIQESHKRKGQKRNPFRDGDRAIEAIRKDVVAVFPVKKTIGGKRRKTRKKKKRRKIKK